MSFALALDSCNWRGRADLPAGLSAFFPAVRAELNDARRGPCAQGQTPRLQIELKGDGLARLHKLAANPAGCAFGQAQDSVMVTRPKDEWSHSSIFRGVFPPPDQAQNALRGRLHPRALVNAQAAQPGDALRPHQQRPARPQRGRQFVVNHEGIE